MKLTSRETTIVKLIYIFQRVQQMGDIAADGELKWTCDSDIFMAIITYEFTYDRMNVRL